MWTWKEDILDVLVFDFPTMLASLFNCPVLNKLENLAVNLQDQFAKYEAPNSSWVKLIPEHGMTRLIQIWLNILTKTSPYVQLHLPWTQLLSPKWWVSMMYLL
jgi:hypothetical protein